MRQQPFLQKKITASLSHFSLSGVFFPKQKCSKCSRIEPTFDIQYSSIAFVSVSFLLQQILDLNLADLFGTSQCCMGYKKPLIHIPILIKELQSWEVYKLKKQKQLSPPQSWRPGAQELRQCPIAGSVYQNGEDHHKHEPTDGAPIEISDVLL